MNAKFKFKVVHHTVQMDDVTKARRTNHIQTLPDGEYEIIIRKAVKWDVAKMRKYFHGPVLGFIVEQFKVLGTVYSKDQIKEHLKYNWGPRSDTTNLDSGIVLYLPASTSAYSFDDYTKFLNDINAWSIECFGYELPPSDEVE